MEALVSGALVMSDVMLSIPPDFVDGESIIFYHNMTDLQNKVLYYLDHPKERLEIARRGWILAFHRHRSWHRMEEVFFGKILSASIRELQ
jgi:spore maturation protein CgeB